VLLVYRQIQQEVSYLYCSTASILKAQVSSHQSWQEKREINVKTGRSQRSFQISTFSFGKYIMKIEKMFSKLQDKLKLHVIEILKCCGVII